MTSAAALFADSRPTMNVPRKPVATEKNCRKTLSRSVRCRVVATYAKTLKPVYSFSGQGETDQ